MNIINTNYSKQIYNIDLKYPFEIVLSIFNNSDLIRKFTDEVPKTKVKRFLGSSINIDGSGYIWQGKNENCFSFECNSKFLPDFFKSYFFKIKYINNDIIKEDISISMTLYKNTNEKTTVLEFSFCSKKKNNEIYSISSQILEFEFQNFLKISCDNLSKYIRNSGEKIILCQTLLLNLNYKVAFKLYLNFESIAKAIGTDKMWKINFKNDSKFSVSLNEKTCIDFQINKKEEDDDKNVAYIKKSIDSIPSLNDWIKVEFHKIDEQKCLMIYQTKIPININIELYHKFFEYLSFILQKWKTFVETHQKNDT